MLAYHDDLAVKQALLARIADHEAHDAIVQGTYGRKANGHYERCAVGCSVHDLASSPQRRHEGELHNLYPSLLGLPVWLARLEDAIFEGLPEEEAVSWPRRFAGAVPVGADLSGLEDRLAVRRLRGVLSLAPTWPDKVRGQVVAAIEGVVVALDGNAVGRAESAAAARSAAESAAESAARSAAWSAAWLAESAAVLEELSRV